MNSDQLLNRTLEYSKRVISLINKQKEKNALLSQLLRSATSIGANYREAISAESKRDFIHKISICKKEANETLYWIELVAHNDANSAQELRLIWKETKEFLLIFSKTLSTAKLNLASSTKRSMPNKK